MTLDGICGNAFDQLEKLQDLPENWDGEGAFPIRPPTLEHARRALAILLPRLPDLAVYPNPHGTVSFEWRVGDVVVDVEVGRNRFSGFLRQGDRLLCTVDGGEGDLEAGLGRLAEEARGALSYGGGPGLESGRGGGGEGLGGGGKP